MGHQIQCFIGKEELIRELANNWIYAQKVDLSAGFSAVPLTDHLAADMNELANLSTELAHEGFLKLSKSIELVLQNSSNNGIIGYIETEYFGGSGSQSAISYSKGNIQNGPYTTKTDWDVKALKYVNTPIGERAINSILYGMGLKQTNYMDGFDNLGLGKYRSNEKFLKR